MLKTKEKKIADIELNEQFKNALGLMEDTSQNIFVTGKAGTGKSTLLDYFRAHTAKQVVILAPTGVAALNVKGQTIHSFFGFKPDITIEKAKKRAYQILKSDDAEKLKRYRAVATIIIDEVSMVRADVLDCVDIFLRTMRGSRELPFGGVQMIFIGDLYQLPPVVTGDEKEAFAALYPTSYFFSSFVLQNFSMAFVELEKIYRQKDERFIHILNAIRNNTVTDEHLIDLNVRTRPAFLPPADEMFITLTPTNAEAQKINEERLAELRGKSFRYEAELGGEFTNGQLPTDNVLTIKKGSQVMMVCNDSERRFVNGSVGKVVGIETGEEGIPDSITVLFPDGRQIDVLPHTWELFSYMFDEDTRALRTESAGTFTQYPLKLAWAVTIHKSQGKTFDKVVIDMGRGAFAHGQTYVALSRCTSLEGLILKKPILRRHIFIDRKVVEFVTKYQYHLSEERVPKKDKVVMIEEAIRAGRALEIVYLKANDEKTTRVIDPRAIGDMEYNDKKYLGVEAFCHTRGDVRRFRVDRILEMDFLTSHEVTHPVSRD